MLKSKIFAAQDLRKESVTVAEWDAAFVMVQLNGRQLGDYRKAVESLEGMAGTATLIAFCAHDETGVPLFELADVPQLLEKSPHVLQRLAQVAHRVNALDVTVEETAKN